MNTIKTLRSQLDQLDLQISSLLNERMKVVEEIAQIKHASQLTVTDKLREMEVLQGVKNGVDDPLLKETIVNIYSAIMKESRIAQKFFQYMHSPFKRIGIVGLGLMGGSICKAIKIKDPSIQIGAMTHEAEDHASALQERWIDRDYTSLEELIDNCELLILASPISTIVSLAEEIKKKCRTSQIIIMDIASVKGEITRSFETLTDDVLEYVSTHPMSGREVNGFVHSEATLFVNAPWIIVPHKKNQLQSLDLVKEFTLFLGAEPMILEPEVHDRQTALISHLPGIISKSLYDFVRLTDQESESIAGPGYHSVTRLAHGSSGLRQEIASYNKEMIQRYLSRWIEYLKSQEEGQ